MPKYYVVRHEILMMTDNQELKADPLEAKSRAELG